MRDLYQQNATTDAMKSSELKKLLDQAQILTVKIRAALDLVQNVDQQEVDYLEKQIKDWERELDRLNDRIIVAWDDRFL